MAHHRLVIDAAHGGVGWTPRTAHFKQELGSIWASCGVDSECGKLRMILLHRPGNELTAVHDPSFADWDDLIDLELAKDQYDAITDIYNHHHVDVIELSPSRAKPNHIFVRDLFAMTPSGAIIGRPASNIRAGEEVAVHQTLATHNVPIILTVSGGGTFEGADMVFADSNTVLLGTGLRTNPEGANQVRQALSLQGIRVIDIQTTYGCGHLDGVLSIVDTRKAVVYPRRLSYTAYDLLRALNYTVITLPNSAEAEVGMAINMVAIEPGLVLMPSGCPETIALLNYNGVDVIPVNVSEFMKGGGAIHCMTGVICRAPLNDSAQTGL